MAKFMPGQSANPKGKKAGTLNKRTLVAKFLEPHAELLVSKAIELALSGDINALRLCIERSIPKARDDSPRVLLSEQDSFDKEMIFKLLLGQELTIAELKNLSAIKLQSSAN